MNKVRQPPEEIAEDLAKRRLMPFDAFGKHWQGDLLLRYSNKEDACNCVSKGRRYPAYGYYIHS